jgi:hypothetical protein
MNEFWSITKWDIAKFLIFVGFIGRAIIESIIAIVSYF